MLKNYLSKLKLAYRLSNDVQSFIQLILNSKKYSSAFRNQSIKDGTKSKHSDIYHFKFNGAIHPMSLRTYSGDIDIFYEIFWKEVYAIPEVWRDDYKIIVDLGAHIGCASIYFATKFQNANIYSVEASSTNFDLLQKNTSSFNNIKVYHAAIYPTDGYVKFENADLSYNAKLGESGEEVRAMAMSTLLDTNGIDHIDLLKIDIEGAEKLLLSQNSAWLEKVECIMIEIHQDYTIAQLKNDLGKYNFEVIEPNLANGLKNIFARKVR